MRSDDLEKLRSERLEDVLSTFTGEELAPLYAALTKPLSQMLSHEERVRKDHPDHEAYADLIARHLRLFGGNSFANASRESGPPYREIVMDVCRSRKLKVAKDAGVIGMEQALLAHLFATLPKEEQETILAEAAQRYGYSSDFVSPAALIAMMASQVGARAAGFMLYRTGLRVANIASRAILNRGLSFAGNQFLVRALGLATGPVGWAVSGMLAAKDIASPALRVTTPCVAVIAGTRQAKLWRKEMGVAA